MKTAFKRSLVIQCLLPILTPRILRHVQDLAEARSPAHIQHMRPIIGANRRGVWIVGIPRHRKGRDVALCHLGHRLVDRRIGANPVPKDVGDVSLVQGRSDVKLVIVAGPLYGTVHVARIADADHFGPEELSTFELRRVWQRAVKYRRVDECDDFLKDAGAGAIDEQIDPLGEVGLGRNVGRCKAQTLVSGVGCKEFDMGIDAAFEKKTLGVFGDENPINDLTSL